MRGDRPDGTRAAKAAGLVALKQRVRTFRRSNDPAFGGRRIGIESTSSREHFSPSTTRSARGCHPCHRNTMLPMSPGWAIKTLASRKGFEPLTPGLGNLCSILLSYREVYRSFSAPIRYSAAPLRPYADDPISLSVSRASTSETAALSCRATGPSSCLITRGGGRFQPIDAVRASDGRVPRQRRIRVRPEGGISSRSRSSATKTPRSARSPRR